MANQGESSSGVRTYKDLRIWQKGMRLTKAIYQLTASFPAQERYGLATQIRRAAMSVPSNIAEGQARRGAKEFGQFLSVARGSLAELETQVLLSVELGYASAEDVGSITEEIVEIQKMVGAIQRKLAAAD